MYVLASISVLCAWWITTRSRPNCIMWQLLAAVEKADQFGFSFRCGPATLPMTPQNIQLLGSTEGAGGHRKKRIVALQNKDCTHRKSSFSAPSHCLICIGTKQRCDVYSTTERSNFSAKMITNFSL